MDKVEGGRGKGEDSDARDAASYSHPPSPIPLPTLAARPSYLGVFCDPPVHPAIAFGPINDHPPEPDRDTVENLGQRHSRTRFVSCV